MEFWQHQMPRGMLLRSSWDASHISDPHRTLTLNHYQASRGSPVARPIPLPDFVEYGLWFQRQLDVGLDRRRVSRIEPSSSGFQLLLEDGEPVDTKRVVVAGGISYFARRPAQFGNLPAALCSHSTDHPDLAVFSGRRVAVIGGGQSALESAALLAEGGAEVEVLVRAPQVRWLRFSGWLHDRDGFVRRLLYPKTDVGPIGLSWIVAIPDLFRLLPRHLQDPVAHRCIRPAASSWLYDRVGAVRVTTGRNVVAATPTSQQLRLSLDDGSERVVDHALLATGYRVNIARYPFLGPALLGALKQDDGQPVLGSGFESSVPGLHILGAPSARSFGPVMRFVAGTTYTAQALTRRVVGRAQAPSRVIPLGAEKGTA